MNVLTYITLSQFFQKYKILCEYMFKYLYFMQRCKLPFVQNNDGNNEDKKKYQNRYQNDNLCDIFRSFFWIGWVD